MPYTLRKFENKRHKIKSRRHKKIKIGGMGRDKNGLNIIIKNAAALPGNADEEKIQMLQENPNRPYYNTIENETEKYLYLGKFVKIENITDKNGDTKCLIFRPFELAHPDPADCIEDDGGNNAVKNGYPEYLVPISNIKMIRYSLKDDIKYGDMGAPLVPPTIKIRSLLFNTTLNVDSVTTILRKMSEKDLFKHYAKTIDQGVKPAIDFIIGTLTTNKEYIDSNFTTIYKCRHSMPFYLKNIKNIFERAWKPNGYSIPPEETQLKINLMNSFSTFDKYFTYVDSLIFS